MFGLATIALENVSVPCNYNKKEKCPFSEA
jgi:hypothetical protein